MTTETSGIVWRPTREYVDRSRIARFMKSQGIATLEELFADEELAQRLEMLLKR